jgi:hypothetical protein
MITVNDCPFCGYKDVEFCEVEPGTIAVECPACQCIGPFADSHDEAAVKWNRVGVQEIAVDYPNRPYPTSMFIADRLRILAGEMDYIAVCMDYYGGFSVWAQHGREIAGAGAIARQWAEEIESNVVVIGERSESAGFTT